MKTDLLIIGQGLAGTWLSYFCRQAGLDCVVIDQLEPGSASRVASGVVNPVTGRGVHTTWLAEELIPFAQQAYLDFQKAIGQPVLLNTRIHAFPPTAEMTAAYQEKMKADTPYVHPSEGNDWSHYFQFFHGSVTIAPALVLDVQTLLAGWRRQLSDAGRLLSESFEEMLLFPEKEGWRYKDIEAKRVVYANGVQTAHSRYWGWVPFSINKGEALILDIPALPPGQVYKFGITTLVPWREGKWWMGSSYDNRFTEAGPTLAFEQRMTAAAQQLLKVPFTLEKHIAGLRPASIDRRPFVGNHPLHKNLWLFNGLGTKGCSLAPFFARHLIQHMVNCEGLMPEVNLQRFERIFRRSQSTPA